MEYIVETPLRDFPFWSGGADHANDFTSEEMDALEPYIDEMFYSQIPMDGDINDLFWFESDMLVEYLQSIGMRDKEGDD